MVSGTLSEPIQIAAYLTVAAGVKMLAYLKTWGAGSGRRKRREVGRVTELTVYPLKSCRGIDTKEAECLNVGLRLIPEDQNIKGEKNGDVRDRHWMVTTPDYGMASLRTHYRLSLISCRVEGDYLLLDGPDVETLKLPIHDPNLKEITTDFWTNPLKGVDCGDEASLWLERVLQEKGLRLVHHLNHHEKMIRPKYTATTAPKDMLAFTDASAFMMISEESLNDTNQRLPEPISMLTLRPNIVMKGCEPYAEEEWHHAMIGDDVEFTFMKPCTRCPVVRVNVDTGERYENEEPLRTLKTFRPLLKENNYSPVLGIKYKLVTPGVIKVGDPVYVLE